MSGTMGNWFVQLLVELGLRRPRAEDEARRDDAHGAPHLKGDIRSRD
ncbi:hypothetical protein [Ancylobacter sp. FA202]|nr:hypothetical protein [Ancylobacter sp. FA202]